MGRYAIRWAIIPILLFWVATFLIDVSLLWILILVPVGILLGATYGLAWYLRFQYELSEDTFDLQSGVIARRNREIPYRRIQTVDVTRTVIHRLLGLAVVRIETAGGGSTEASLDFVSAAEADRIRNQVRRRRDHPQSASTTGDTATTSDTTTTPGDTTTTTSGTTVAPNDKPTTPPGAAEPGKSSDAEPSQAGRPTDRESGAEPQIDGAEGIGGSTRQSTGEQEIDSRDEDQRLLFQLSTLELLVYALFTFRTRSVALVLFALPILQGYVPRQYYALIDALGGTTTLSATPSEAMITAAVVLPSILLLAYLVSAAYGIITYYGFTLARRGDDLVYDCGMFQRYSGSIPLAKVQSLTLSENVPMRRLGYAGLTVETAGYGAGDDGGGLALGMGPPSAIPATGRRTVLEVAREIEDVGEMAFDRTPAMARRRYAARYAAVVGGVVAVAFLLGGRNGWIEGWYLSAALFAVVPVAAHLKWIHRGYHVEEEYIVLRTGFWLRRSTIVPYDRLQTVSRSRTIFQRRLGLAHFVADTASSISIAGTPPTAFDIDASTAGWLQKHCRKRLQAQIRRGTES